MAEDTGGSLHAAVFAHNAMADGGGEGRGGGAGGGGTRSPAFHPRSRVLVTLIGDPRD